MDRRTFLQQTAAATAAGGLMTAAHDAPADSVATDNRPPNLIFVLADQWRFSAFGHGTDEGVRTPHIDALAKSGARFTRAYACNPVCTPNRSVILTGRYTHQTGMIKNNLMIPPSETCMAEVLKKSGYATHYIGKYHLDGPAKPGFVPPGWRRRGFDTFEGFNRGHFYHASKTFSNTGKLLRPDVFEPTYQTDRAIDYIAKHKQKPFYMYLSWGPPHTPYRPPKAFDDYKPGGLKLRPNVPKRLRASRRVRRGLAGYYGLCTALDHEMGRLIQALERHKLRENTLLVFTSDHGDMHGSQGKFFKGHPEEESLHVPLMMSQPGRIKAGQTPDTLCSSLDLMPTLLSACGATPPKTCEGRNLASVPLEGRKPSAEWLYCQGKVATKKAWRCVVTNRHKLAIDIDGNVTHLFDLKNDPYERENLNATKSVANTKKELLTLLKETGRKTGDPFPKTVPKARATYTDAEGKAAKRTT
ncbi:MAG: sulfatase [Planctomycetaceae bacterium]